MTTARRPLRGELWYAYLPGQPDDPHQPRPVLIISENVRNRLTDDVIVVPIFSSGRLGPTRVPLPAGVGGIARDSILFCEEVATLDHDFLHDGPQGAPVPDFILRQVVAALLRAVGG